MPYLLTSSPGSPTSWVKTEGQSQDTQPRLYTTRQPRPLPPLGGSVGPYAKNVPFHGSSYSQTMNPYQSNNGFFATLNLNGSHGGIGNYSNGTSGLAATSTYAGNLNEILHNFLIQLLNFLFPYRNEWGWNPTTSATLAHKCLE